MLDLGSKMEEKSFPPLQLLCHQGNVPTHVHFMTSGLALAYRRASGTEDRVPILFLYPGSVIGEIEPLINSPYEAHVKSFAETKTLSVATEDFLSAVRDKIAPSTLAKVLCSKFTSSLAAYEVRMLETRTEAILRLLAEYVKANGIPKDANGFYHIGEPLIPRYVGMYSGVSKPHRRQIFKSLEERGGLIYTDEDHKSYSINIDKCLEKRPRKRPEDTEG